MTKSLSIIENSAAYLPTEQDLQTVKEELGDILTRRIFGVVTIAGGGAGVFKVLEPGAEEPTSGVQSIDCVILASHLINVRWGHDYGTRQDGERPACRSMNGETGVEELTGEVHDCATCPHNQFGEDGTRKACTNKRQLYIMRENDLLPVLFALPPSALKAFDNYRVQASLTLRTPMYALLTRITLKTKKSGSGTEYSSPVFTAIGKLPLEDAKRTTAFAKQIMEAAQRAGIEAEDLSKDAQEETAPGGGFVQVDDDEMPFT